MTPRAPYRVGDLMALFGYRDVDSFRAWRKRVERQGFPAPILGCARPLKWDADQVDAWKAAGGRPAQAALQDTRTGAEQAPYDELAAARARLMARAAAGGR